MKTNQIQYKDYTGTVEWSDEDGLFYGHVIGIKGLISYEGRNIRELKTDFMDGIDMYLDRCGRANLQPEKPFKGSFNVRVDSSLHRLAAEKAEEMGISLNRLVGEALKAYLN